MAEHVSERGANSPAVRQRTKTAADKPNVAKPIATQSIGSTTKTIVQQPTDMNNEGDRREPRLKGRGRLIGSLSEKRSSRPS
jgi:hypothetical protein